MLFMIRIDGKRNKSLWSSFDSFMDLYLYLERMYVGHRSNYGYCLYTQKVFKPFCSGHDTSILEKIEFGKCHLQVCFIFFDLGNKISPL